MLNPINKEALQSAIDFFKKDFPSASFFNRNKEQAKQDRLKELNDAQTHLEPILAEIDPARPNEGNYDLLTKLQSQLKNYQQKIQDCNKYHLGTNNLHYRAAIADASKVKQYIGQLLVRMSDRLCDNKENIEIIAINVLTGWKRQREGAEVKTAGTLDDKAVLKKPRSK
jgi:hypothetical protein